jgi:hypothetical protein
LKNEIGCGSLLRNRYSVKSFEAQLLIKQIIGSFRYDRKQPEANSTYAAKSTEKRRTSATAVALKN